MTRPAQPCVHIHRPRADMEWRGYLRCHTCEQRRRFVFQHVPYYGVTAVCCACGDAWSDGYRMHRGHMGRERAYRRDEARQRWARLRSYDNTPRPEILG